MDTLADPIWQLGLAYGTPLPTEAATNTQRANSQRNHITARRNHSAKASHMKKFNLAALTTVLALGLLPVACSEPAQGGEQEGGEQTHGAHDHAPTFDRAVAQVLAMGDSGVSGTIVFTRSGDKVTVSGEIRGLTPGKHGFHIHELGDLTDMEKGLSAGGHFAPGGHQHGKPGDAERHVGDLGNVTANAEGVATVNIEDTEIALGGAHSIVGRSVVVHRDEDTFGQPTGNAGPRVGVGVIGVAK